MSDSDPVALFSYVLKELNERGIAYVHLIEPRSTEAGMKDGNVADAPKAAELFRSSFHGTLISAGGYDPELAKKAVESGEVDAVAFGRWFISNPDLPARIQQGAQLNKYDRSTFYGGAEKGYTDYQFLQ
jgi:N-ethylmaleimide reductase